MRPKQIKSKRYWITTVLLLWLVTFFFSLVALFIYETAKKAFQAGFYTLPLLLLILTAIGVVLRTKIDIASKLHPVSLMALLLILLGISWYFAVNWKLMPPEEVDFVFKFSILLSLIFTLVISITAVLIKRRTRNAYELLEELKNRS